MKRKNIGIFVTSLNAGGAERAAANLSRDLSDDYNVYLLLFNASNIAYPHKGKIIDLNYSNNGTFISWFFNALGLTLRLMIIKIKYHLCAVISFMPATNQFNVLSVSKSKTIVSIRNTMSKKNLSSREKRKIIKTGKMADMTVSVAEGVRLDLIQNFDYNPNKVITIYNSCDPNWFKVANDEIDKLINKFDFSKPVFVTVGRLHNQKGQWHLIRAFSLVQKKIPGSKLVIFGAGDLEIKLKKYASKLGVMDNIYFMGFRKGHHAFMEKCDAFILPSIYEGFANAILEAIACGIPVISTDCLSGPRELLCPKLNAKKIEKIDGVYYGEYGILIPPFTDTEFDNMSESFESSDIYLADAMIAIAQNSELQKKYQEKALIRSRAFLPINVKSQWKKCIEDVLTGAI